MYRCSGSGAKRTRDTLAASWRAEVWGQPVAHSLSPALHNAAYRALGLSASYERREVSVPMLPQALHEHGPGLRGISLTMPLKEAILELVADHRGLVDELGAANTVVGDPGGMFLWNSDPAGVAGALGEMGVDEAPRVLLLGAGATARSVLAALAGCQTAQVTVASRDHDRARRCLEYAAAKGFSEGWLGLGDLEAAGEYDLVVSTLPHGVNVAGSIPGNLPERAALLDVTYHPWPSPLAALWEDSPRPIASGRTMLLHQALVQVRLFVQADPDRPLPSEEAVFAAMRGAVPPG